MGPDEDNVSVGKLYINGKYLCDVGDRVPTISSEPFGFSDDIDICQDCSFSMNPTLPPRRWFTCRSRKRFVKKIMSLGYDRNQANALANVMWGVCYTASPYFYTWLNIVGASWISDDPVYYLYGIEYLRKRGKK